MLLDFEDRGTDPIPLYYKLESVLREAIAAREYKVGQCLPSERELGELYRISRVTVRRALETLEREGLVRRQRGRGTIVVEAPARRASPPIGSLDRIVAEGQVSKIKVLAFDIRPCDPIAAGVFGLAAGDPTRYFERLISTSDGPVAYARNFLPMYIGEKLRRKDLTTKFMRDLLIERYHIKLAEARDEVEATLAEARVAAMLNIRPASPLLRITRLLVAADGRAVNLSTVLVGSKYRMKATLSDKMIA